MDIARIVLDVVGVLSIFSGAVAPLLPSGRPQNVARAIGLALPEALRALREPPR